jgi:hypothetical protein
MDVSRGDPYQSRFDEVRPREPSAGGDGGIHVDEEQVALDAGNRAA